MKRVVCLLLLLCLLAGCGPVPGTDWAEQFDNGGPETATVAYIPLDNRPVNTTRVALLARSAGFCLQMPEEGLYRTALDGQPLNPNGTQYGDGEALLAWLENTDADYYVISVDQILSGGLVNSRWMGEMTDEPQKIRRLLTALEGKKAILLDTVMRLAPTVGYGGCTLAEYEALRAYGRLPRRLLTGELSLEQVLAGYRVPADLDGAVVSRYLAARSRKLQLSAQLLSAVSGKDNILVYYGIDDSSPETNIQTNEIAFIRQNLQNGSVFAGTDEMGLLAVSRTLGEHYGIQNLPTVGIRYFGADPSAPADAYDIGSLEDNLTAHLQALGIAASSGQRDLELLVFGGDAPTALIRHYKSNLQKGLPTMIVDLGTDFSLPKAMLAEKNMDFSYLLSYSAWNTAGNSIGIALSNGVARYLYLKCRAQPVKGANAAFLQGLALSFAKDISYASVKSAVNTAEEGEALRLVQQEFEAFASILEGKQFLTALAPSAMGSIPPMSVKHVSFPWQRSFEAEIKINVG